MSEQRITPTVILPDTSPLFHLAAVDALPVLNGFGRVVVVDVVMLEATYDQGKPYAREIAAWIEAGGKAGSNRPVEVAATELGPLYKLALDQGVKPPRNVGAIATAELFERMAAPVPRHGRRRPTIHVFLSRRVRVGGKAVDARIRGHDRRGERFSAACYTNRPWS